MSEQPKPTAMTTALHYLDKRRRTEAEVRSHLSAADYESAAIDDVIARLQRIGVVNDRAFAIALVHDGQQLRGYGRDRLRRELRKRGVDAELIEETLADQATPEDDVTRATELACAHSRRWLELDLDSVQRRLVGYLQRRGFGAHAVWAAVKAAQDKLAESPDYHPRSRAVDDSNDDDSSDRDADAPRRSRWPSRRRPETHDDAN